MKKLFLILLLCTAVAVACSKDEKPSLSLSKEGIIEVQNTSSTLYISVNTKQKWDATENVEWINLSQNGSNLEINILANNTSEPREADINVIAGNLSKKITIKQAAGNINPDKDKPFLSITPNETIEVASEASEQLIGIKTNQKDWTFSKDESIKWLTLTQENDCLKIKVSVNETTDIRIAEIVIKAGDLSEKLTVKQKAGKESSEEATLTISPEGEVKVTNAETEKDITVSTNQEIWNYAISENTEWITVSKTGNKLNLKIAANNLPEQRTATIKITAGSLYKTVTIIQEKSESNLNLPKNLIELDYKAQACNIEVNSNLSWTVEEKNVDWISYTINSDKNSIEFNVKENESQEKREAVFTIKDAAGTTTLLTVVQFGKVDKLILPLLEPQATQQEVKDFEAKRGSKLTENSGKLNYHTLSEGITDINYTFKNNRIFTISANFKEGENISNEYIQLLKKNNFEEISSTVYIKNIGDSKIEAHLLISDDIEGIVFLFVPAQTSEMQTFTSLPIGFNDFNNASETNIINWEKSTNESTLNKEKSDPVSGSYCFEVKENKDGIECRMYLKEKAKDVLLYCSVIFNDTSKFFYTVDEQSYITKEFNNLLKANGYIYQGLIRGAYIYTNNKNNYRIEVTDMKPYVEFKYMPIDSPAAIQINKD